MLYNKETSYIKTILKLFLPPIFRQIRGILKKKSKFFSSIHKHKKKSNTIFIFGNGPSIKEQLEEYCDILSSYPCICVNYFVSTEYYEKIKPSIYVLMDPNIFTGIVHDNYIEKLELLWKNLFEKTTWNMDIIVPSQFRNHARLKQLKKNLRINVLFCNMLDCSMYLSKKSMFELFNKNKLAAPAQTVINTAIFLAIFWRYKNIILLGADTSWHEEIKVDQKTNILYIDDKHFYDSKTLEKHDLPTKLHEEFYYISKALEIYHILNEYANYNSVSVYNASKISWIDAFERKSLEEIFAIFKP